MHTTFVLLSALLSSTLSLAAPTAKPSSPLTARSCKSLSPSLITQIISDAPDASYGDHPFVTVSNGPSTVSGFNTRTVDTLIRFDGFVAGDYGCELALQFPSAQSVTASGATSVNIYTLTGDVSESDTWNSAPAKQSLWGTVNLASGNPASSGTTVVINSETCASSLSFRLELAGIEYGAQGSVDFENAESSGEAAGSEGLAILYDC
jgi:hypothetical protein